jgi:hypothetical protein
METARDLKPTEASGEAVELETAYNHVYEAEVATGGLVRRLTPAAVEAGPVVGRFAEMQAACSCASGCPTCIIVTAGSFALPFVFRNRKNGTETDQQ